MTDKKYGEFVGVDNLYYAPILQDDNTAFVTGTPVYLAPAAEISGEAETNNTPTYYDNKPAFNYVSEGVTTITITASNVPAAKMATLLGKLFDAASGRVYDSGQPNPPSVAVGFRYNVGPGEYRYYWYLKGTFSGGAEEAATKSADVDIRTYQLTYTAVTTTKEWTIGGQSMSLKRVFADTSDSAFAAAGWFSQVQTPDTTMAPTAIALSTIAPADGATAFSRSGVIVLTFNNKIATEAITLLDSTTGNTVAFTKSWDVAGKVLTLTPSAQLAATTKYIVAVAGVVDVYGQALAASGKDFTTGT
ncbi:major tail protein [Paenibacillus sp. HJGM_3]|uniref:major tail protein n=1 Tax=Paenibacillus sp. HJGM_3 TaxID=3379816 RepID=UPI00385F6AD4